MTQAATCSPASVDTKDMLASLCRMRSWPRPLLVLTLGLTLGLALGSLARPLPLEAQAPDATSEGSREDAGTLVVRVVGLHSDDGIVLCALFGSAAGWPGDYEQAVGGTFSRIESGRATCSFEDVPAGRYAVAMFHDEDESHSMARGVFGIPREGYGFSNNVGPRAFGPPRFRSAAFDFDGSRHRLRIRARY